MRRRERREWIEGDEEERDGVAEEDIVIIVVVILVLILNGRDLIHSAVRRKELGGQFDAVC